jgi:hypothetical protein
LPLAKINPNSYSGGRAKADIMKNFLFTDDDSINNVNPISGIAMASSSNDTSINLSDLYANVSTVSGKKQINLFADPTKNGGVPNP